MHLSMSLARMSLNLSSTTLPTLPPTGSHQSGDSQMILNIEKILASLITIYRRIERRIGFVPRKGGGEWEELYHSTKSERTQLLNGEDKCYSNV